MSLTRDRKRPAIRSALLGAAVLAGAAGLAACGDDSSSSGSGSGGAVTTAATTAETYAIVGDAEVLTGFAEVTAAMARLADSPESAAASFDKDVFEAWEGFEGTVKKTDTEIYLAIEDALNAFKRGAEAKDADAMNEAEIEFGKQVAAYMTAHPSKS